MEIWKKAVVETEDDESDPIEEKIAEIQEELEKKAIESGSTIIDNEDDTFEEVVKQLNVEIPDAPTPTPGEWSCLKKIKMICFISISRTYFKNYII